MANVLHKITKQYLNSVNTPDYPTSEWLINPVLPNCDSKFWVIEDGTIREMTQSEKGNLAYTTESTIYLIAEKKLMNNINGKDYETDSNAVINPVMPECEFKHTKVVNGIVVEMNQSEKDEVDLPDKIKKAKSDIVNEIRKVYTIEDEIDILGRLMFGSLKKSDQETLDYDEAINAAKIKYPKIYTE